MPLNMDKLRNEQHKHRYNDAQKGQKKQQTVEEDDDVVI